MSDVATEPPVLESAVLEQIAQVASEEGEELTSNQTAAIIAAYHHVVSGDPVGTIRRDPETGSIALKTQDPDSGLLVWRVSVPDGTQYNDLQPTLPWPVVSG